MSRCSWSVEPGEHGGRALDDAVHRVLLHVEFHADAPRQRHVELVEQARRRRSDARRGGRCRSGCPAADPRAPAATKSASVSTGSAERLGDVLGAQHGALGVALTQVAPADVHLGGAAVGRRQRGADLDLDALGTRLADRQLMLPAHVADDRLVHGVAGARAACAPRR